MELRGTIELPDGQVDVGVDKGCRIVDAADQAGILLDTSCAGLGTCGGCAVDLLEGN